MAKIPVLQKLTHMHLYEYLILLQGDLLAPIRNVASRVVWVQLTRMQSALQHFFHSIKEEMFQNCFNTS